MIINDLDLNYGALIACIFNEKLTMEAALTKMGIRTKSQRIHKTNIIINAKTIFEENLEDIKNMYLIEKCGLQEIVKKYGMSTNTISKYLRVNGVEIRKQWNREKYTEVKV